MGKDKKIKPPEDEFAPYMNAMQDGNIKSYICGRVLRQIKWFDKRSLMNQWFYKSAMIISIIISGCIPVITLMLDVPGGIGFKLVIAGLSSCITVISAVCAFCKFSELWIQYRMQCEMLKSILHRFFAEHGPHGNDPSPFIPLISKCEEYMKKEAVSWAALIPYHKDHSIGS
jgi:uncharacterized protein (DUF486 family)